MNKLQQISKYFKNKATELSLCEGCGCGGGSQPTPSPTSGYFDASNPILEPSQLNRSNFMKIVRETISEFNEEERNLLNEKWWWNYDKCGCENTTMMPDGNAVTYKSCCGSSGAPCSSRWDCPRPKKGGQLMDLTSLSKNI
jgi:hypothetical protein